MASIIVERIFASPPSAEDLTAAGIREKPCLQIYGVIWKRSLSGDRLLMVCEYEAGDAESVRKVQREAGNGFDNAWAAQVIE